MDNTVRKERQVDKTESCGAREVQGIRYFPFSLGAKSFFQRFSKTIFTNISETSYKEIQREFALLTNIFANT